MVSGETGLVVGLEYGLPRRCAPRNDGVGALNEDGMGLECRDSRLWGGRM